MSFRIEGVGVVTPGHIAARLTSILRREVQAAHRARRPIDADLALWVDEVIEEGTAYRTAIAETEARTGLPRPNGSSGIPPPVPTRKMRSMTTAQTADRLGCTDRNVRGLAERGAIAALRIGGRWTFDADEVDEYARHTRAGE